MVKYGKQINKLRGWMRIMKKTSIFVLAGLVIVGTIGSMMVCAENQTSVYVEHGTGSGEMKASLSGHTAYDYDAEKFKQMAAGLSVPVNNWKLGLDYQNAAEPEYYSAELKDTMVGEGTATLIGIGYQVMESDRAQIWINGSYLANELELSGVGNSGLMKYTTDAFLIGPEFRYDLTDRLQLRGLLGYGVGGSQEVYTVANGSLDCSDVTALIYNIKLNYEVSDHLALGVGYRSKQIESKLEKINGVDFNMDTIDVQNVVTVGVTYQF
jgi:predicted porin